MKAMQEQDPADVSFEEAGAEAEADPESRFMS